MLISAN